MHTVPGVKGATYLLQKDSGGLQRNHSCHDGRGVTKLGPLMEASSELVIFIDRVDRGVSLALDVVIWDQTDLIDWN